MSVSITPELASPSSATRPRLFAACYPGRIISFSLKHRAHGLVASDVVPVETTASTWQRICHDFPVVTLFRRSGHPPGMGVRTTTEKLL